jgi:uncharacterized protein (TIGR03435 family)
MRRWLLRSVLLLTVATIGPPVLLHGQAPQPSDQKPPAFEVASIKRNTTVDSGGGGGFAPGGHFHITNIDVQTIVMIAHRTGPQLFRSQIVGGPDWIASETYDITATVSDDLAGKPLAELFAMQPVLLHSLLEDRFKLKSHRETRELQRYALVLAKKDGSLGPQLRRFSVDCSVEPRRCGLQVQSGRFSSESTVMSTLVNFLGSTVQRVVLDRTGLDGRFGIMLEFTPDRSPLPLAADAAPPPADKPSIFTALQDQLGLKLEPERGPVDVVVIDHIERPTEN